MERKPDETGHPIGKRQRSDWHGSEKKIYCGWSGTRHAGIQVRCDEAGRI